ncbi:MAG: glycosyltransferase [Pseudolabrys sp.]
MSSSPAPGTKTIKKPRPAHLRVATSQDETDSRVPQTVPVARDVITVLIVVPTLDGGAVDAGALELVRILRHAGHHAIVTSRAGRLVADVTAAGAEFVPLDVASNNPLRILRSAGVLARIARERHCDVIHALGRSGAWSAYFAARLRGIPFVTSWYKGFREQNFLKRAYNGVMVRGARVIAVSEQIAQLANDRYGTPWDKIVVVPGSIDFERFDPAKVTPERIAAARRSWGIKPDTKVILIAGRILRRKGHHVVVKAIKRLKDMGLKDFLCVFVGEDRGHTHYTGELWDLVLSTGTTDVIRMAAPVSDMPAAYAAASVVVSGAIQPEGVQRAIVEAQAMARPVIVSDLAAGTDVVLTAPAVPDSRATGLRFHTGEDAALAAALLRLFSMTEADRAAIGQRGRDWVLGHFNADAAAEQTLRLYGEISGRVSAPALMPQASNASRQN